MLPAASRLAVDAFDGSSGAVLPFGYGQDAMAEDSSRPSTMAV